MNVKISNVLYILGFASIVLSAGNFVAGKTEDGQAQESQERNGLFVGFWPPPSSSSARSSRTARRRARTSSTAETRSANEGTWFLRHVPASLS